MWAYFKNSPSFINTGIDSNNLAIVPPSLEKHVYKNVCHLKFNVQKIFVFLNCWQIREIMTTVPPTFKKLFVFQKIRRFQS